MTNKNDHDISRREALEKLAKLSIYTAPTVTALLSSSSMYAAGSCSNMNNLNMDKSMNMAGDGRLDKNTWDRGMGWGFNANDCN